MWETRCQQCGWTSGERVLMEAADVLGEIHEMDHPGSGGANGDRDSRVKRRERPIGRPLVQELQ